MYDIKYKFLNMDLCKVYNTNEELLKSLENIETVAHIRLFTTKIKYNQILVAGGTQPFTQYDAVKLIRKLLND